MADSGSRPSQPRRTRIAALATLSLGVIVLAGCGDTASQSAPATSNVPTASPSADDANAIMEAAVAAYEAQEQVHYVLTQTDGTATLTFDVHATAGGDGYGSLVSAGNAAASSVEFRVLGEDVYVRADEDYWSVEMPQADSSKLANAWVKGRADVSPFKDSAAPTGMAGIGREFSATGEERTVGPEGAVNGITAIPLHDSAGETLWIAAEGSPLPLRALWESSADQSARLDLSGYGTPVTVPIPPADQVVKVAS